MTDRTDDEIIANIQEVLESYVAPAVASHGGEVNFISYSNNKVLLELSGACSGCSGSTMTLKYGVEHVLRQMVPEVQEVEGIDDPFSTVDPFYTSFDFIDHDFIEEDLHDPDN